MILQVIMKDKIRNQGSDKLNRVDINDWTRVINKRNQMVNGHKKYI